jgi:hypothetical protein
MVIHSSSLTFSRVGLNRPEVDNNQRAQKNYELPVSNESYTTKFIQPPASVLSPDEIKLRLDDADLNMALSPEPFYKPTDARTLKALNAYTNAINQPLQDRRAELIAGIDLYV